MAKAKAAILEGTRPCLFLSHSGVDSDAAKALKTRILSTKAAREAGLEVWFDKDDLLPGVEDWQTQLEKALGRATAFAVMVGSKGVVNWVEREVRVALSRATGPDAIPFIPVIARDSPGVAALPAFAQQHQGVFDPIGNDEELRRLVAAALSTKPSKVPLLDEPFVGLRSMTEADAGRFFGRDEEVKDLVASLKRHRLLAVVADSGAGKSSLAMAGLVPAFRGGAFADPSRREPDGRIWHVIVMRPGNDPVEGLRRGVTEAAEKMNVSAGERAMLRKRLDLADVAESAFALRCDLPADRTETLLVVDQFDELLTETPEANRAPFVDFLTRLASLREPGGVRVVLTVRADYFNLCRPFEGLYRRLADADDPAAMRLKRISDPGLEQAVKRPLELAGYERTDDAARLARRTRLDLGDRAGDLALAQMALYVVWKRRQGPDGTLLDAYADVGGVTGALAQEAERIRTEKLTKAEAALLTPLFVRLVRLGDTGGAVRRICRRDELDPARQALADRLCSDAHGRLLLAGDDTYEVCHEALITQWPWLQDELNRAAADLRDLDPLMRRASLWAAAQEADKPGHLATGVEREAFAVLAERRDLWLSEEERSFVASSESAYRRQQTLRKNVLRSAVAALFIFVVLSCFAAFSWWRAIRAEESAYYQQQAAMHAEAAAARAEAEARRFQEETRRALELAIRNETVSLSALSRVAQGEHLPAAAVKLALAAWPRIGDAMRPHLRVTAASLANAILELRDLGPIVRGQAAVNSADFSPDGLRVVTASSDGQVGINRVADGKQLKVFTGGGGSAHSAAYAKNSDLIIVGSGDGTARVWNPATDRLVQLRKHGGLIYDAALSADGTLAATASGDHTAKIWDAASGAELAMLQHSRDVNSVAFSDQGDRVLTASSDKTARVWNISRDLSPAIIEHTTAVWSAAFSPDGSLVATAAADGVARLWDPASDIPKKEFAGHEGELRSVAFSRSGDRIVTGSTDGTAVVWDVKTGAALFSLRGHTAPLRSVRFAPDGMQLATASADGTARLWSANTGRIVDDFEWHTGVVSAAQFSPDGTFLATSSWDKSVALWRIGDKTPFRILDHGLFQVRSVSFSGNGKMLVTASSDRIIRTWNIAANSSPVELPRGPGEIRSATISGDGSMIAAAYSDGTAVIWDVATQRKAGTYRHTGAVGTVAFSSDGKLLLTGSDDSTAAVWRVGDGSPLKTFRTPRGSVRSAVFLGNTKIVVGTDAGMLAIIPVADQTPSIEVSAHSQEVASVSVSNDSNRLATSSADGTAIIWDANSGVPLLRLQGHRNRVNAVAFSPTGDRVVTASDDRTARIWDISSLEKGDAFQIACERLGNDTSLKDVQERYGLGELTPVCGDNPPLPVDWTKLQ